MNADVALVLGAGLAFAGSHLVLGSRPVRERLIARLGVRGFTTTFATIALASLLLFAAAMAGAGHGGRGPGAQLGAASRAVLGVLSAGGLMIALAALRAYPASPAALLSAEVGAPRGIEKLTRHGFFVGFGSFCAAHALLVTGAAAALGYGLLAALCGLGALRLDRKLLLRHGEPYARYMASTSVLPGVALLRGRVRIEAADRFGASLRRAALGTLLLGVLHPLWALANGALLIALAALGGAWLTARRLRDGGLSPAVPAPPVPPPSARADVPPGR